MIQLQHYISSDADECAEDTDNACGEHTTCVNAAPGYTCTCGDGWLLEDDQRNCYSKCTDVYNKRLHLTQHEQKSIRKISYILFSPF